MANFYFSASKLIEYAFASPQRRHTIIKNALTPPNYILDTKYRAIEIASSHYLASGCKNSDRLAQLDATYLKQNYNSEHQENRLLNAHDAIECVTSMDWVLPENANSKLGKNLPKDFNISGLDIRVKPSAIFSRNNPALALPKIGVAKAYFSKTFPLITYSKNEPAVLYGVLLHWYVESTLGDIGEASPELCIIGDVFQEKTSVAPKRFKQRRKQLEALAQEICDRVAPIRSRIDAVDTRPLIASEKK
ncbi:MAG: hypothetical protein ABJN75_11420 [Hoeflea sp.]|uniref:hypothetical protein n=1 Tax=Hoeflea sp. TaxID=1940281 RepID=UPI00329804D8